MSAESRNSSSGVSFISLLQLLFIALKLLGHIEWSWVWVLAPTWLPIAVLLVILLVVFVLGLIIKK